MNLFERLNSLLKPPSNRESVQDTMLHAIAMQARRAHDNEDYDQALELYAEAQKIAQNSPSVLAQFQVTLQLADTLIQKHDYAKAYDLLSHAKHLAEVQHIRSLSAYILCSLGVLAQAQGDTDTAQTQYEHARAMAKTIRAHGAQGRATAHLGDLALLDNNLTYAIHLLREAIPLMERSGDTDLLTFAYGRLGTALIANGQIQQGKYTLNKAIEVGLERRQVVTLREISLQAAEYALSHADYALAFHHYSNALKLFPRPEQYPYLYAKTHALATYCAFKIKKIDDAQRLLNTTQSLASNLATQTHILPDHAEEITTWVNHLNALLAHTQKDYSQVILNAEKAMAHKPTTPFSDITADVCDVLAHSYAQTQQPDKVFEIFQQAIERAKITPNLPYEAFFVAQRADFYLTLTCQREKALQDYQSAVKQYETLGQHAEATLVHSHIARLEAENGQGTRAIKRAEQALLQLNTVNQRDRKGATLENVADIYIDYADMETTEGLLVQALDIAKEENNKPAIAKRRGKLGYLFALHGKPEKAIIELTLARNESREASEPLQAIWQTSLLGVAYRGVSDINTALAHHYEAIANLNYERHPEETAWLQLHLADTLYEAQKAIGETRHHYDNAFHFAEKTDNVLLKFVTHLGIAKVAIFQKELAIADDHLKTVQDSIQKSHSKRLQAELKTLQSRYWARMDDYKQATSLWAEADLLRRMLQMPTLEPTWL
jgi:tetratricopeptide (TPR) repeat protein